MGLPLPLMVRNLLSSSSYLRTSPSLYFVGPA